MKSGGGKGFVLGLMLIGVVLMPSVRGHGRLIKPPSRGSMWRYGYNTPPNYSDNQLWCGGVTAQYAVNDGRCGLCGDPFNGAREHEAGGKYATGIIVETYMQGGTIEVEVDITANHKGWFEFRLCANNDPSRPITQECLDENLLKVSGSGETRIPIGSTVGIIETFLDLPADLSCTQCVLQWKYNTGNNWGTDPDGTGCVGCGNQEQFYGCSDVAISTDGASVAISTDGASVEGTSSPPSSGATTAGTTKLTTKSTTTTATTTTLSGGDGVSSQGDCVAIGAWSTNEGMDDWCNTNCAMGYCPPSHCACGKSATKTQRSSVSCLAVGPWVGQDDMDRWCEDNCALGFCPETHCVCGDSLFAKLATIASQLKKIGLTLPTKNDVGTQHQGEVEQ